MDPLASHEKERVARILLQPFTMASVLYAICLRALGEDIHHWEPETLWMEIKDEFGVELPAINHTKLSALLAAIGTNSFYHSVPAFLCISRALNGEEDPFDQQDPLLVAEMAWAVREVQLNDDAPHQFNDDVSAFAGALLMEDGFTTPPAILGFAKIPERYQGSSTDSDRGREGTLSTEHAQAVAEYLQEQSALLVRQICALPWHNEASVASMVREILTQ